MKLISEDLVAGILAYLLTRPMKEVEIGVMGLRNLQDAPEPDKDEANGEIKE